MTLTAEMIREAEAHLPFELKAPPERWEWMADFLNDSLAFPNKICPCCNVTKAGEILDHLPSPTQAVDANGNNG
jgi:hypothetical protein